MTPMTTQQVAEFLDVKIDELDARFEKKPCSLQKTLTAMANRFSINQTWKNTKSSRNGSVACNS